MRKLGELLGESSDFDCLALSKLLKGEAHLNMSDDDSKESAEFSIKFTERGRTQVLSSKEVGESLVQWLNGKDRRFCMKWLQLHQEILELTETFAHLTAEVRGTQLRLMTLKDGGSGSGIFRGCRFFDVLRSSCGSSCYGGGFTQKYKIGHGDGINTNIAPLHPTTCLALGLSCTLRPFMLEGCKGKECGELAESDVVRNFVFFSKRGKVLSESATTIFNNVVKVTTEEINQDLDVGADISLRVSKEYGADTDAEYSVTMNLNHLPPPSPPSPTGPAFLALRVPSLLLVSNQQSSRQRGGQEDGA